MCDFCENGKPLINGKTDDYGIAVQYPNQLIAYGYDISGFGTNGLTVNIKFCPLCGRKLSEEIKEL